MSVLENVRNFEEAMKAVKDHPMCGSIEDDGARFVILYPAGDFASNGLSFVYLRTGKTETLGRVLKMMEKHWLQSYPGYK